MHFRAALFLVTVSLTVAKILAECVDSVFFDGDTYISCNAAVEAHGPSAVCSNLYIAEYCCKTCQQVNVKNVKLVAEGFFVVDAKNLETYYHGEMRDKNKATEELMKDFNFFLTEVNSYYDTLKPYGLDIDISVAGVQILDTDLVSDKHITQGDTVHPDVYLNILTDFLQSDRASLSNSEYDFALLLTAYNMEDPYEGYTYPLSMCHWTAHGIVEMTWAWSDSLLLAHEIGHALGAYHDPPNSVTVMRPVGGSTTDLDRYRFSSQSAREMIDYLGSSKSASNCLRNTAPTSEVPNVTPENYKGKLHDIDTVCTRSLGYHSSPCTDSWLYEDGINGDNICLETYCHSKEMTCTFVQPLDGTPCGQGKSCRKGLCVEDSRSQLSQIDDNCVFGNDKMPTYLEGTSCEMLLAGSGLMRCNSDLRYLCCDTCKNYTPADIEAQFINKMLSSEGMAA